MRKRVAMAQNWIIDRDIVLMDEPFSALDIHTRQRMETELLALWETSRKTVVFVTHDLEEALALADEVIVLSAGPASRIVSRHVVRLERPRDLFELRTTARSSICTGLSGPIFARKSSRANGVSAVRDRHHRAVAPTVLAWQLAVAAGIFGAWEWGVHAKLLDPFFLSRPSAIAVRVLRGSRADRSGAI